jgi:hypothetical protein
MAAESKADMAATYEQRIMEAIESSKALAMAEVEKESNARELRDAKARELRALEGDSRCSRVA